MSTASPAVAIRRLEELPEPALERLAKNGSDAAFEILVTRAYDRCMRLAIGVLGDADEACDEVQNALWRAYTHLNHFEQQSRFGTWLGRIVINRCLTRRERRQRSKTVSIETSWGQPARGVADRDSPECSLARKEIAVLIRAEVGRLPALLREPLEFHHFDGLPLSEVAARLGISLPAAKSRLNRAHSYLRQRMARHCGARGAGTLLVAA